MALSCPSYAAANEVRLNKASLWAHTPWAHCSPCPAGGPIEPGVYGDDFARSSCLQEATNESIRGFDIPAMAHNWLLDSGHRRRHTHTNNGY